jgi:hypothetical protein
MARLRVRVIRSKLRLAKLKTGIGDLGVFTPMHWILINLGIMGVFSLFVTQDVYLSKLGVMIFAWVILNGWFWGALMMSYLWSDESQKFVCANFSASLGMDNGAPRFLPPIIRNGSVVESQYTVLRLSGINLKNLGIHTRGRVMAVFPSSVGLKYPGGGWDVNANFDARKIDELPEHVQNFFKKQGGAVGIFNPDKEIWFTMTPYYSNPTDRQKLDIEREHEIIALNREISKKKSMIMEQDRQIISSMQKKTRLIEKGGGGSGDFDEYHAPSESIFDQSTGSYQGTGGQS